MRVVNLFGDLEKADPCNGHHACPHDDERKTNEVGEFLAWHRKLATCQGGRCYLKKEVELFDQETKCHDGDGSSHPREKCALIGGMIAEIPDHRGSPVLSFPSPGIATASLRVRKPQGDASLQCPCSCRSRRARARSGSLSSRRWRFQPCPVPSGFSLARAGHLVRYACLGARIHQGAPWDPVARSMGCHGCKLLNIPQPPECSASLERNHQRSAEVAGRPSGSLPAAPSAPPFPVVVAGASGAVFRREWSILFPF